MSKIKLIITDFDNTLEQFYFLDFKVEQYMADYVSNKYDINKKKFLRLWNVQKNDKNFDELDVKKDSRLRWLKNIFLILNKRLNKKVSNSALIKLEKIYWREINKLVYLYPGVKNVFGKLKKKYKIVMLSNSDGSKNIKLFRINKLGLKKYFDLILTTDDTGYNKPDRRNIEIIMKRFGVKPSEIIVLGDYPRLDLEQPKKMGITTILTKQSGMPRKKYGYIDYEINNIKELPALIRKIDSKQTSVQGIK